MSVYLDDGDAVLHHGDALATLRTMPSASVHCIVTSPPFWALRDYGTGTWSGGDAACTHQNEAAARSTRPAGGLTGGTKTVDAGTINRGATCGRCGATRTDQQIGLEASPDEWCAALVAVFREARRVLRPDGVAWIEVGDTYASAGVAGLKPKDLCGAPWLLAFALRTDGWHLRAEQVWHKPSVMPESVTDRPTRGHSTIFLLSRSPRYFFDSDAIRDENGANARSVWTIPTEPTPFAHFATFPQALAARCILAGTSGHGCCAECGAPWTRTVERTKYEPSVVEAGVRNVDASRSDKTRKLSGAAYNASVRATHTGWAASCACNAAVQPCTVLDPFAGSATTLLVARRHGRRSVGIELSAEYLAIAATRLQQLSLLGGDAA